MIERVYMASHSIEATNSDAVFRTKHEIARYLDWNLVWNAATGAAFEVRTLVRLTLPVSSPVRLCDFGAVWNASYPGTLIEER